MKCLWALPVLVAATASAQPRYPATRTVTASDTYFGTTYPDPYRWLESLKDKEVEAWFKAQAELTDGVLATIPGRDALAAEWMALDKLTPATYGSIAYENGRVFYKKTLGGENVGKLFYREGWTSPEKPLFDPAAYKAGVTTTIQASMPSWDGQYVLLALSSGGAEYSELRVIDVAKGVLLPDSIYPSWFLLGWLPDSKSFFYDATNTTDLKSLDIELNHKTRVHTLGTNTSTDRDVFSNASSPELSIAPKELPLASIDEATPSYVVGNVATVQSELRAYYAPTSALEKKKVSWTSLAQPSDKLVRGLTLSGDKAYALTYVDAPRYKLVSTSLEHPDWSKAETVVPEAQDSIQYFAKSKSFLFLVYSNGITGRIVKYDLRTKKKWAEVKLPRSGTVDVACPDVRSDRCIVWLTSWTVPTTLYDLDGDTNTLEKSIFNTDVTYPGFDALVSEEVEVPGHDGTLIPLSIIHRKDLKLDGSNSAILEGYGAYGISYTPYFDLRNSIALRGVVVAYAHSRGGGEKGEAWYRAGYKTTKPNTWKDFIACGEYLVKKGYTSPQKLAGTGTSAGGISISRAVTERPDLFAAAVCNVGVANALRAEFSPNGPVNTPEFGTVKDEAEAKALFEMDGVQHVQKGVRYPAVLGVGGWNDPRVAPWQPGKFVAALQVAGGETARPALLKVNYDNGHFTEEKLVTFSNFASQYAFLLWQTGHKDFQPAAPSNK